MTDLASLTRTPEDLSSVALLQSAKGAELHLRGQGGALLFVEKREEGHLGQEGGFGGHPSRPLTSARGPCPR